MGRRGSRSESRFSTIFRLCPVGLALAADEGLIVEANPALARLLELDPEEIAGHRLLDFTHPDDRHASSQAAQSLNEGHQDEATLEKRYLTRTGAVVPVRVTMIALEQPEGDAHKLVQVEDMSQWRATEENLRREANEDPLTG